jgi:hypothetical protein
MFEEKVFQKHLVPRKPSPSNIRRKVCSFKMMSAIVEVGLNSIFPLLNLKVGNVKDKKDTENYEKETIESDDKNFVFPTWLENVMF